MLLAHRSGAKYANEDIDKKSHKTGVVAVLRVILGHVQVLSIASAIDAQWSEGFLRLFAVSDAGTTGGIDVLSPDCAMLPEIDRDSLEYGVDGIPLQSSPAFLRVMMSLILPVVLVLFGFGVCATIPIWVLSMVRSDAAVARDDVPSALSARSLAVASTKAEAPPTPIHRQRATSRSRTMAAARHTHSRQESGALEMLTTSPRIAKPLEISDTKLSGSAVPILETDEDSNSSDGEKNRFGAPTNMLNSSAYRSTGGASPMPSVGQQSRWTVRGRDLQIGASNRSIDLTDAGGTNEQNRARFPFSGTLESPPPPPNEQSSAHSEVGSSSSHMHGSNMSVGSRASRTSSRGSRSSRSSRPRVDVHAAIRTMSA